MSTARGATMDFFGHQQAARRATRRLLVLFVLAVAAIIACIYFAAATLLVATDQGSLWQPEVLLVTAAGTLLIVGLATAFKTAQLRSGGGAVARQLGGRRVDPGTTDARERMLRNLVEEMAIASGVPVPDVYVLDQESALNAFAAGWATENAAIAVTRGCLDQLDRDELQGVIAHEFSHVFHGDMRLNLRLVGVLFGIVCIATIGRVIVRSFGRGPVRTSGGKKGGAAAGILLFGVALIAIGYIGVLFARLIQAAISRQREFLADASAVQYTRNPRGIGMALAKIGGLGGRLQTPQAETASHMLFADGVPRLFGSILATHPPIRERVVRILPGAAPLLDRGTPLVAAAATAPLPQLMAFAAAAPPGGLRSVPATGLLDAIGEPGPQHVAAAQELLRELPLDVQSAARDPQRVAPLVLALLLDSDGQRRSQQIAELTTIDPVAGHDTAALAATLRAMPAAARLPLLDLAVPALRHLAPSAANQLRQQATRLSAADGTLQPFEIALSKLLDRHLPAADRPRHRARSTALAEHAPAVRAVLGALAHAGNADDVAAAAAFDAAVHHLGMPNIGPLPPRGAASLQAFAAGLEALATVSPLGKRNLLTACATAAGHDGRLTAAEAELLRAVADCFDCPMPLVVGAD